MMPKLLAASKMGSVTSFKRQLEIMLPVPIAFSSVDLDETQPCILKKVLVAFAD